MTFIKLLLKLNLNSWIKKTLNTMFLSMPCMKKIKETKQVRKFPKKIRKTEKDYSNLNIESEMESKVKKTEFGRYRWTFFKYIHLKIFFKGKVAKRAT